MEYSKFINNNTILIDEYSSNVSTPAMIQTDNISHLIQQTSHLLNEIYEFKSLRTLTTFAVIMTVILTVIFLIDIIIEYLETTNIKSIFSIGAFPLSPVSSNLLLDAAIDEIYFGILIFHVIIFFWWIYRANNNIHLFGAKDVYSPKMAVIWFFIPLFNLRNGYEVTRQIWKASDPSITLTNGIEWDGSSTSLRTVKIWWFFAAWIFLFILLFSLFISTFLSFYEEVSQSGKFLSELLKFTVGVITTISIIISTVYYIKMISQVTKWQNIKTQKT